MKTILLLWALIVGSSSVWADPIEVLSWDGTQSNVSYTSGYTYVKSEKGDKKSGYFQDSGTAGSSVISFSLYHTTNKLFSSTPSTVTFTANLGGGSAKDPLDNGVRVCFLDKNGTEISGSEAVVTTKILGKDASGFSVQMSTEKAANAYGVKLYHTKENSYNVRYYSFSLSYEEGSSSAVATTTTIDDSGITNTDVYAGTAAGSLVATIKDNGNNSVEGATVTWSGNNDDVATINASTGAVTLVAAGTVTFTATYAGVENEYESSSDTYEMTVTDSTPIPTYTVTLGDDNTTLTEEMGGAGVTLPSRDDNGDYTFVGWSEENISVETTTVPTYYSAGEYKPTQDVTLYPVYTRTEQEGSGAEEWVEIFEAPTDGYYAICSADYFMKASTASNRFENGDNTPIISDGKLTVAPASDCTWEIYKALDNNYRIKNGTNYAGATGSNNQGKFYTKESEDFAKWTITYNNGFVIENVGMASANKNKTLRNNSTYGWASYGASTGLAPRLFMKQGGITTTTYYVSTPVADTKQDAKLSFSVTEVNANIIEQFEAPTLKTAAGFDGTVEYSSSDEAVAQIMDSETGDLMLLKEGTTIITATFAGNDNFKAGSASYTLTVTDNRIATTITQENIVLEVSEVASLIQLNPVVKDANNNVIPYEFSEFLSIVSFEQLSEDDVISSLDGNTGQITLSGKVGTATLKAYYNRFNGDTTYKPSECTFTITVEKVMTISEVRAQGTGSVTTKGIVTSCSGTTAYIQDANAAICVYGSELTIGDEVKVKGTLTTYNGLLEITSPTVTVLSQNNTVTPEVMTIAEINASEKQGWLVKIENATVTAINGQSTTIAQGDNTIVVRGITGIDIALNDVITLTGNIGYYSSAAQIANPTDVSVKVATPTFSVAEGIYTEAQSVELSTTTEGATIYYTIDGTEPTAESTKYTGAIEITVTTTIKAIAVKDDVVSDVATATYTINLTPSITISTNSIEATAAGADDVVTLAYSNLTISGEGDFEVQFYDGEGEETETPDWIVAEVADDNEGYVVYYAIDENTSTEPRTAYFKVYAMDGETNLVYSNLVTVTQEGYVAPDNYALFTGSLVEGDYIIYYDGYAMNTNVENGRLGYEEVTPENDVISTNNGAIVWHIAKSGEYWTIYNAEANAYAASTGVKNKAQMLADGTDDMALWTVSGDGEYEFVNNANSEAGVNAYLRNNGSYGFACYASSTGGDLLLYKRVPATITATITLAQACTNGKGKYYGTYSNASAFVVPSDLTVAEIGLDAENKLIVTEYATGAIVPANTGVMVSSTTYGDYSVELTHNAGTSVMGDNNRLRPTGNEGITAAKMDEADSDCVFYRLTMHNKTDLGFYWGDEEGSPFAVVANKAYLAVQKSEGARILGFSFDGDSVTGISQIENGKSEVENYFDLQGRSIANPAKGLYIKNGKKVVIR